MERSLQLAVFAYLDEWAPAGLLDITENDREILASSFRYGTRYLGRQNAIEIDPVSLSIQDRESIKGKAIMPLGGLPYFGGIRDAAPDAWGRRVIENKLNAPPGSLPESTYLLEAGSGRVGALDIRSSLADNPSEGPPNWADLEYLMLAADRIEEGLPVPQQFEMIFRDGTALGGARPKASVRDERRIPWLAKFSTSKDPYSIPDIEMAALRLAKQCGLTVPEVKVEKIGTRKIMLIRRFDRYFEEAGVSSMSMLDAMSSMPGDGSIEKRLHFCSALTLLNCHEADSPNRSYGDIADAIRRYCHPSVIKQNQEELFGRMVYNILVSNDDDHLRNHGFIYDPSLKGWRLSPLYDVLPKPSFAFERYLHLGIGAQGRLATINNALSQHERFGISMKAAEEIIERTYGVVREWKVYFEDYGVAAEDIKKISPAIRRMDDVR